MNRPKHLKAFTLSEIIIVMVLTGIFLLAAGQMVLQLQHTHIREEKETAGLKERAMLDYRIQLDADRAARFFLDRNIVSVMNEEGGIISSYLKEGSHVIRQSDKHRDTFRVNAIFPSEVETHGQAFTLFLPGEGIQMTYHVLPLAITHH